MGYKARKRWALFILLVGMPAYVVLAVSLMGQIQRLPLWLEVPAYLVLGFAWIVPFKRVFLGVGQADPAQADSGPSESGPSESEQKDSGT